MARREFYFQATTIFASHLPKTFQLPNVAFELLDAHRCLCKDCNPEFESMVVTKAGEEAERNFMDGVIEDAYQKLYAEAQQKQYVDA